MSISKQKSHAYSTRQISAKVKNFWDSRAAEKLAAYEVTHGDIWQRWLEIEMICRYLKKTERVLDIGCGNGYSTRIFADFSKQVIGIDYSEAMIERARGESFSEKKRKGAIPEFHNCNILDLTPEHFGFFDTAISERCLINLRSFEEQKQAIINIASVLKHGGHYIFIEGCGDGRAKLNDMRQKVGLSVMPTVWHNIDFAETETLNFFKQYFVVEDRQYFGIYDFLSRVVHPLLVAPKEPRYDARINEIAAHLSLICQELKDLSRVFFILLRRKKTPVQRFL